MGDRFTFGFVDKTNGDTIYLYSHWGGESKFDDLKRAISHANGRWDDVSYANRIAISQIVGESWKHSTGYGLSVNSILETEYPFVLVTDFSNGVVSAYEYKDTDNEVAELLVVWKLGTFVSTPTAVLAEAVYKALSEVAKEQPYEGESDDPRWEDVGGFQL